MPTSSIHPDLTLNVHQDGPDTPLVYQLRIQNPRLGFGILEERFEPVRLIDSPASYLASLYEHIDDLSGEGSSLEDRLAGIGVNLAEQLLPEKLHERLFKLRKNKPAPSLLLVSNALWIPWELFKLRNLGETAFEKEGPFLVEAFALTRWIEGRPQALELPLRRMAIVRLNDDNLGHTPSEAAELRKLYADLTEVPAHHSKLLDALASGRFDGWHFTGHGISINEDGNTDLRGLLLADGRSFTVTDLADRARGLGETRPWVFLNACRSARNGFHFTGIGGMAKGFLQAGAGAFIGTHWDVRDEDAAAFAVACYQYFHAGRPLGEAVRRTRVWFRKKFPESSQWLACAVFGHPLAVRSEEASRWAAGERSPLRVANESWHADQSPPGALLRAEYGVVPFHGRTREFEDLDAWCEDDAPIAVRLLTGSGGMGKTRLLLETCRKRRIQGWEAGFLTPEADRTPTETWDTLRNLEPPRLIVIDYAETRRDVLLPLLRGLWQIREATAERIRIVLLARAALDWWEQLRTEGDGVDELLGGPMTSERLLDPLALSLEDRKRSYHLAAKTFAQQLARPAPSMEHTHLDADYFERVLLLHMAALAAAEGVPLKNEDNLLDHVLGRERRFWTKLAQENGLPKTIVPGLGRAMAAVTLTGGAETETEAVSAFAELQFFKDRSRDVLIGVARLLHQLYPGDHWIEPLMPDILGEHLIERELEEGADELFDLAFR